MLRNITLHVEKDYDALSQRAAEIFAADLRKNPGGVYGFATGSTPEGMYKILTEMNDLDFTGITAFNLDEYHPIKKEDPQSYYYFMAKQLFDAVKVPLEKRYIPDGLAADPARECDEYEGKLASAGGIDLQILGIGVNGHIGFNEPTDEWRLLTGYVPLAESTIESNARNFIHIEDVPRHALTMGLHSIMMARRIMLLASGSGKAEAVKAALAGPVTPMLPASILQFHPNVTVVVDQAAGALL